MFGPVLYFDLSPTCGQPLSKDDKLYKDLWKIHEKIDASVVKDLHANDIKLSAQLRTKTEETIKEM